MYPRLIIVFLMGMLLLTAIPTMSMEVAAEEATEEPVAQEVTPESPATEPVTETPSPEMSETPTAEVTAEVTVTIEATETVTPEATAEATVEPTAELTLEATAEVTAEATQPVTLSAPPSFNLSGDSFETSLGIPLEIALSVSDDVGLVRVEADTQTTLGGVSISSSEPLESEAPFNTQVVVTYLPAAGYIGLDSFALTAIDSDGQSVNTVMNISILAAAEATPEVTAVVVEDMPMAALVFTVNSNGDTVSAAAADGICDVDAALAGNQCTLREAIKEANGNMGFTDTINFSLPAGSVITVLSALPSISDPVNINGPASKVTLDGEDIIGVGLFLNGAGSSGSKISGLAIANFIAQGITIQASDNNIISGNYIGVMGNNDEGGNDTGILISNASNNLIGGNSAAERNVISGNNVGVSISSGSGNIVSGNYVGTDKTGKVIESNLTGILIVTSTENRIGGATTGERNLISGNQYGIRIQANADNNVVQGNYIGTDVAGKLALPNEDGVYLNSADENTIGGLTTGERNLISGNTDTGLTLLSSDNNTVLGNYIGTTATGNAALANEFGIQLDNADYNSIGNGAPIGSKVAGGRNIISGNSNSGIRFINGASDNHISGNYIGTNVGGTKKLGNFSGIYLSGGAGDENGIVGNLISGNWAGIAANADASLIHGNYIGTDRTGKKALGNEAAGITIDGNDVIIGGHEGGFGNVIAFNGWQGIFVDGSTGVLIRGNSIFQNSMMGIEFINNANNGILPPVLNSDSTSENISGFFAAVIGSEYQVEVFSNPTCDSSGRGEGQTSLGTVVMVADNSPIESFSLPLATPLANGVYVTATITNVTAGNDTSEFSDCLVIAATAPKAKAKHLSPAPNGIMFDSEPEFSWGAVALADDYRVEICAEASCTTILRTKASTDGARELELDDFVPNTPLPDGVYYWRVQGNNDVGDGVFSKTTKFTVDTVIAPKPSKPVDGGFTSDTTPTLSWAKLKGAVSYEIHWTQDESFGVTCDDLAYFDEVDFPTKTSYTVAPGLAFREGTVYWCVYGYDAQGNISQGSPVFDFEITLMKTVLDDVIITDTTPAFSWNKSPGTDVEYRLVIDDEPTFAAPRIVDVPDLTKTSYTLTPDQELDPGQTYFWRVFVGGGGTWTIEEDVVWNFLLLPAKPVAPVLVGPANGAAAVSPNNIVLDWNVVAGAPPTAVIYRVLVDTEAKFVDADVYDFIFNDSFDLDAALGGSAAPNTRYFWKVQAIYVEEFQVYYGPLSRTFNFTTGS